MTFTKSCINISYVFLALITSLALVFKDITDAHTLALYNDQLLLFWRVF